MTESEWLACDDPARMLKLYGLIGEQSKTLYRASDRKLRLFACACCRQVWPLLTDERSQHAVEVAELFADGATSIEDLEYAQDKAHDVWLEIPGDVTTNPRRSAAYDAYACADRDITHPVKWHTSAAVQAALLREIIGNPFHAPWLTVHGIPPEPLRSRRQWISYDWLTPTVLSIAQTIYEEHRFQDMPILADALEDAGCQEVPILAHLRRALSPVAAVRGVWTGHVRGCWALDLLLGKE